jgi:uncharacterized RDD family membrane protein YckC
MFSLRYFAKKFSSEKRADGFSYADFSSRYMSILFDFFILILILKFISFGFISFSKIKNNNESNHFSSETLKKYQFGLKLNEEEKKYLNSKKYEYIIFQSISLFFLCLYLILSWYYLGGTIGNLIFGFRIVSENQETGKLEKLSLKTCFLRLFFLLITILTLFIGFFSLFFNSKKQSLHDKFSNTIAIKSRGFLNFYGNDGFIKEDEKNLMRFDVLTIFDYIKKFIKK